MRVLLDTTVLIDVFRRRNNRRAILERLLAEGHELCTSALNVAEVYAGIRSSEEEETETFLEALECFSISRSTGKLAGKLKNESSRKGKTLAIADTIVAAVALEQNCVLATDNVKDFAMHGLTLYPLSR
jgi:predicted nucleic acid-binding protein